MTTSVQPETTQARTPRTPGASPMGRFAIAGPLATGLTAAFALIAFSFWGFQYSGLESFRSNEIAHRLFDPGQESSIYTALSVIAMGCAALTWAIGGYLARRAQLTWSWGWFAIALVLFAFAIDESAQIHEELGAIGTALVGHDTAFSWLAIGIPLGILVMLGVAIAAWHIPRRATIFLLAGLTIFFAGALGMEFVMDQYLQRPGTVYWDTAAVAFYHVEEFLELSGIIIVACAPFRAMTRWAPPGRHTAIRIDGSVSPA